MKQLVFSFSVILLSFSAKATNIVISKSTAADTVCAGTHITFTAQTDNGCTPAWQWLLNGAQIPGATADTFSTGTLSTGDTISVEAATSPECELAGAIISNGIGLHVISAPAAPVSISGNTAPCSGAAEVYAIEPVAGASSYIWNMPAGWTGSSTDTGIIASIDSSGAIMVEAVNVCGSSPQTVLHLNAQTVPAAPSNITGSLSMCAGSSETYTVLGAAGSSYIWTLPMGWSGHSAGNAVTCTSPSAGSGVISVSSVNGCGASAPISMPVIVMAVVTPTVSIATPNAAFCAGVLAHFTATPVHGGGAPQYRWMLNGSLLAASGPAYATDSLRTGDIVEAILISDGQCVSKTSVQSNKISVYIQPTVTPTARIFVSRPMPVQAGLPLTFTASVTGGGTAPGYQWLKNGEPVPFETNPTFTTSNLKHGDTISVRMTSSAACPAQSQVTSNGIRIRTAASTGVAQAAGAWSGSVNLYPNPSNGRFTVVADWSNAQQGQTVHAELLNMTGQSVYSTTLKPEGAQLRFEVETGAHVANGMYQLKLRTQDGQIVKPVLIQR